MYVGKLRKQKKNNDQMVIHEHAPKDNVYVYQSDYISLYSGQSLE